MGTASMKSADYEAHRAPHECVDEILSYWHDLFFQSHQLHVPLLADPRYILISKNSHSYGAHRCQLVGNALEILEGHFPRIAVFLKINRTTGKQRRFNVFLIPNFRLIEF
jgi:hypothetical protein